MDKHQRDRCFDLLVTGSTGFVGQMVLARLQSKPELRVMAVCRRMPEFPSQDLSVTYAVSDLTRPIDVSQSAGVIVHIAAEKRDVKCMWEVNVEGTRRLLKWASEMGVEKFIHLSSVGVYGAATDAGIIDTNSRRTPRNTYERSKLAAEDIVKEWCDKYRIKCSILQPSNVIGINTRSQYPLLGLLRAVKSGRFINIGRHDGYVNYVDVENVVESIFHIVSTRYATGTYILNTPAKISEFIGEIANLFDVQSPQQRIPRFPAACLASALSVVEMCTGRKMPFDLIKYRELTNQTIFYGSEIEKSLNFNYTVSWRQMLSKLNDTYRRLGLL